MMTSGTGLDGQLFESSFAAQLLVDPKTGRVVRANAAASALYGISNAALRAQTLDGLIAAEPDKRSVVLPQQTAAGIRDIEFRGTLVQTEEGPRLWLILYDLTDRRQTERALHAEATRYREMLDHLDEAYFEINLQGRLTFFNDALCRI